MDTPSPNEHGREWLDSPARRVNPPSKQPADLPPAFESGNGYEWCESCGVHVRTEALRRHKKSVIHRANVVQYAQWTAVRSASAGSTTSAVDAPPPQLQIPPELILTHDPKTGRPGTLNTCGAATLTSDELAHRFMSEVYLNAAKPNSGVRRFVNCLRIATLVAMAKKLADPAYVGDTSTMLEVLVPPSLTDKEREERESAINNFCSCKYDRATMLAKLGLDPAKPDKAFIRDYHLWADALDIETLKADNETWMLDNSVHHGPGVAYVWSAASALVHDHLPSNRGRSSLVHGLIKALGLLDPAHVVTIEHAPATGEELLAFHGLRYLAAAGHLAKGGQLAPAVLAQLGLEDDCPPFRGLAAHIRYAAGGSLAAARWLLTSASPAPIAIHFDGGRHHATRGAARGFCYVNDIALAIQTLRSGLHSTRARPVVYLDLDVHHGDGVESAFLGAEDVLTVSLHHVSPGFYPGTGAAVDEIGVFDITTTATEGGRKRSYVNVPLDRGCTDATLRAAVDVLLARIADAGVVPAAVVVQCGADGLAGDPRGAWNLSHVGLVHAVALVRARFPRSRMLLLGGGGYDHANVARAWSHIAALAVGLSKLDPHNTPEVVGSDVRAPFTPSVSNADAAAILTNNLAVTLPACVPEDWPHADLFGPLLDLGVETKAMVRDANVPRWPAIRDWIHRALELAGVSI
ncbi:Histone deacetylase 8 [Blastocladiella emersonii ATCC 22665]|nr:Histone deacetylase 8 [Blastocladiella emersonii ATCC 22665]